MYAESREPLRVMMIAPYPRAADRIDGGVAAATMYLCHELAVRKDISLVGVRIARRADESRDDTLLGWPVANVSLGRFALTTLYCRQSRRIREIIRRYDPDVVHAQGADIAGLLAVNCGKPAVVTAHGLLLACAKLQSDPVNRLRATLAAMATERRTIRRAMNLIAISPYILQHYEADIRGRVYDVPNAIGPEFFDLRRNGEHGRFLYAGRIASGKGLDELIEAVASNPGSVSRLVLAGAAPDPRFESRLKGKVNSLGLGERVEFTGLLSEHALLEQFARAAALVLPSHQETAPMVIQQAMAAGLPVIATRVGGIPHQIEHGVSGLLVEAGDVAGLAAAIGSLNRDATLAVEYGRVARRSAESRFRASAVADATISAYRAALGATRRPD